MSYTFDEESRNDEFVTKIETKITHETAPEHNPYHVKNKMIYGYDHMDLLENCNFADVIYLLLRGNLPSPEQSQLFNKLAIALICPSLRHPAGQASMIAGVGKSDTVNILPIALGVYGGKFDGAGNVEDAIRYFRKASRKPADEFINEALNGDIPTIGTVYGDADTYANILIEALTPYAGEGKIFSWLCDLHNAVFSKNVGITKTSIAAAIFADLGFQPRHGCAIMQLLAAPGLLAHGLEFSNKPLTSMVFEPDEAYTIEETQNG